MVNDPNANGHCILFVLLTYLIDAVFLFTLGIILANILVEAGIFGRLNRLNPATLPCLRV